MAKFMTPVIQDNPSGWGPCAVPEQFRDMPYQPFSKGDRLGKVLPVSRGLAAPLSEFLLILFSLTHNLCVPYSDQLRRAVTSGYFQCHRRAGHLQRHCQPVLLFSLTASSLRGVSGSPENGLGDLCALSSLVALTRLQTGRVPHTKIRGTRVSVLRLTARSGPWENHCSSW